MGSIAIVDDCAEDAAELARMVRTCRRLLGETVPPCWEVSVFSGAAALSARIDEGYAPDLAFVDVVLNPDTSMADSAPYGHRRRRGAARPWVGRAGHLHERL